MMNWEASWRRAGGAARSFLCSSGENPALFLQREGLGWVLPASCGGAGAARCPTVLVSAGTGFIVFLVKPRHLRTAQPVPSAAFLAEGILPLQTGLELAHLEGFDPCERQAESMTGTCVSLKTAVTLRLSQRGRCGLMDFSLNSRSFRSFLTFDTSLTAHRALWYHSLFHSEFIHLS